MWKMEYWGHRNLYLIRLHCNNYKILIFIILVTGELEHKLWKYYLIFFFCVLLLLQLFFKFATQKEKNTNPTFKLFCIFLLCNFWMWLFSSASLPLSSHVAVRAACLSNVTCSKQIRDCSFVFPNGGSVWNKQCLCILMWSLLDLLKNQWGAMKTGGSWSQRCVWIILSC